MGMKKLRNAEAKLLYGCNVELDKGEVAVMNEHEEELFNYCEACGGSIITLNPRYRLEPIKEMFGAYVVVLR